MPFAFVFLATAFIRSISRKIYLSAFIGTLLFILSILAAFFIFGEVNFTERVHQGGYLGIVLGLPLLKSVGPIASWVILVAMLAVSTMVALNLPFYKLIKKEDEEKPLVDNIVVKRGGEVVDANKETKPVQPKSQPVAKVAKVDMTDREFVIKHLKHGKWTLPPL